MEKILYINHIKIDEYWKTLDETGKKECLDQLPERCKSRVMENNSLPEKLPKKQMEALAGGLLLQRVFGNRKSGTAGRKYSEVEYPGIVMNEHGRPEMPSESFYFSISHSFDYTILAIADRPVGADIEKIRPVRYRMALVKRLFPFCYQDRYDQAVAEEPDQADTVCMKLWTCLEAVLKAEGCGFSTEVREMEEKGIFDGKWITTTQRLEDYFITMALPAAEEHKPTSEEPLPEAEEPLKMLEIDPLSRREKAMANFLKGYNCSQSMVLAYSDLLPIDEDTLMKLSCSFGGGIGRLREVCGAFSGTAMITGLLYGYSGPETGSVKNDQYARIQELAAAFEKRNGSIICRELLGLDVKHDVPQASARTAEYYQKRPCGEIIGTAAEILERFILVSW